MTSSTAAASLLLTEAAGVKLWAEVDDHIGHDGGGGGTTNVLPP